jgi:hypothetical protein
MQKITVFIFFFLLITQSNFAQSNFVEATIIQKDGKETQGQMDYQEWIKNPQKVVFRSKDTPIKAFLPSDIKGFTIKNNAERYLSSTVTFNIETLNTQNLKEFNSIKEALAKPELKTETVFLLTLKTGFLNLYAFTGVAGKEHFFLQKGDAPFEELSYRKVIVNPGTQKAIRELKDYISLLKKYMFDCPEVFDKLEDLPYKTAEIMQVFEVYNNCKNKNIYTKSKDRRQTAIYAIVGMDKPFMTYSISGTLGRVAVDEKMNEKISPIVGLGYDFGFIRNRNRWGLVVELLYKKITASSQSQYPNQLLSSFKDDYLLDFSMNYVQLNTFLRHTFYNGKVQSYFKVGPGVAFISEKNNVFTLVNGFTKEKTTTKVETLNQAFSLNTVIGVKKGDFFFEGRLSAETNISPNVGASIQSNYLDVVLGYAFPIRKK